MRVYLYIG